MAAKNSTGNVTDVKPTTFFVENRGWARRPYDFEIPDAAALRTVLGDLGCYGCRAIDMRDYKVDAVLVANARYALHQMAGELDAEDVLAIERAAALLLNVARDPDFFLRLVESQRARLADYVAAGYLPAEVLAEHDKVFGVATVAGGAGGAGGAGDPDAPGAEATRWRREYREHYKRVRRCFGADWDAII